MKKSLLSALVACCGLLAGQAYAADSGCEAKAVDKAGKPLAGAAKSSFMKKCEKEAKAAGASAACETAAGDKKLAGAAKSSFVKKCVKDGGPK